MGFQDRIFQAHPGLRSLYPGPQEEDITGVPEVLPSQAVPVWAARVLLGGLAGLVVAGRQTTTWTAKVDDSLTRLVTTSALPRRRVTCAGITGYLSIRVSGSLWV